MAVTRLPVPPGITPSKVANIPEKWSATWFRQFIKVWLQNQGLGSNLQGSGSTAASNTSTVTLSAMQPNTNYFLAVTLTSGSGTISSITKHTGSFVITWTGSVTNTYDWLLAT